KYSKKGFVMYPQIDKLPTINTGLKDNKEINANYFFDTGADVCVMMSDSFVNDSNVLGNNHKTVNVSAEGSGGKIAMKFTTVKEFQIGPYKFQKVPAYVFKDEYNVTRYP